MIKKQCTCSSKRVKVELLIQSSNLAFDIYPKQMKLIYCRLPAIQCCTIHYVHGSGDWSVVFRGLHMMKAFVLVESAMFQGRKRHPLTRHT